MAYFFFFSYAKEDDGETLRTFFKELASEVARLQRWPENQAGWIDQNQRRGETWDDNIADALATVKALVSLYTPWYFAKEYCGREVEVMLRRRRLYRELNPAARPSNIVPVYWDPCEEMIARTLPKFFVSRDRTSLYEREGLRYIIELGEVQRPLYVGLKRQIAREIIEAARFRLPPPAAFTMAAVRNAFVPRPQPIGVDEIAALTFGPASATFLYVGQRGWEKDDGAPFAPPEENGVAYVCASVAESIEVQARELVFDANGGMAALERLAQQKARVAVIVDSRVLNTEPYRSWLAAFDAANYQNCAMIVVGPPAPGAPGPLVRTARRPIEFYRDEVLDATALANGVETCLQALRDLIASTSGESQPIDRDSEHRTLPSVAVPVTK